jgi:hypothetical protein
MPVNLTRTLYDSSSAEIDEESSRTLLAVKKAEISAATYESVTVSFQTGPNLQAYPYRVSCFARDSDAPVTMTSCMDIQSNQDNLAAMATGTLPLQYSEVSVRMTDVRLRAAAAVDCFVEVSGIQSGKCKYAGGLSFENYQPCPLTCSDVEVNDSFFVNGKSFTKRDAMGLMGLTEEEYATTCTTGITDFSSLFLGSDLNPMIGSWDVRSASNLSSMFNGAANFNQELTCWDVLPSTTCTDFGLDATAWISTYGSNTVGTNPPLSDELIAAGCTIQSS